MVDCIHNNSNSLYKALTTEKLLGLNVLNSPLEELKHYKITNSRGLGASSIGIPVIGRTMDNLNCNVVAFALPANNAIFTNFLIHIKDLEEFHPGSNDLLLHHKTIFDADILHRSDCVRELNLEKVGAVSIVMGIDRVPSAIDRLLEITREFKYRAYNGYSQHMTDSLHDRKDCIGIVTFIHSKFSMQIFNKKRVDGFGMYFCIVEASAFDADNVNFVERGFGFSALVNNFKDNMLTFDGVKLRSNKDIPLDVISFTKSLAEKIGRSKIVEKSEKKEKKESLTDVPEMKQIKKGPVSHEPSFWTEIIESTAGSTFFNSNTTS